MKETIKKVLERYAERQINLTSEVAREELAREIALAIMLKLGRGD